MRPTCSISILHRDTAECAGYLLVHLFSSPSVEIWKEIIHHFQYHLIFTFPRPTFIADIIKSLNTLFHPHGKVRAEPVPVVDLTRWGQVPTILFTFDSEVIQLMDPQFIEKVMFITSLL